MTNSDDRPSPAVYEPPAWDEYRQLRRAVHDYLDHDPDDSEWDDIWRALAAILSASQRESFVEAFGLAEPADRACMHRLITGEAECSCATTRGWHERELAQIGARDEPPHEPPHSDHATLWLDESGDPAVYSMHVYPDTVETAPAETADPGQERHNGWSAIYEWAAEWGLELSLLANSWYHLGSTVQLVFYEPDRYS
jgi:hypothetical protein